jgi:hypothetical protein
MTEGSLTWHLAGYHHPHRDDHARVLGAFVTFATRRVRLKALGSPRSSSVNEDGDRVAAYIGSEPAGATLHIAGEDRPG